MGYTSYAIFSLLEPENFCMWCNFHWSVFIEVQNGKGSPFNILLYFLIHSNFFVHLLFYLQAINRIQNEDDATTHLGAHFL